MAYLYETHLHTCQGSACGRSTGSEHARYYKEIGFQGIIVTDHFFGGNTAVPYDLPWRERVDMFCAGYEDALCEGQKIGLDVFFGWEQGYGDDEYLVYGLDKRWLLNHPEVERWSRREQLEGVHRYGGCVIQAHPFRTRHYIQHVRLAPQYCDGIEAANAGNKPANDAYALRYGQMMRFPMTAGSDNHYSRPGMLESGAIMGISLERKLSGIGDLVQLMRSGGSIKMNVPEQRFYPDDVPDIESFYLDESERIVPTGRRGIGDWENGTDDIVSWRSI